MEIIIQPDSQQASLLAARLINKIMRQKEKPVLGLATGHTPLLLYRLLVQMHRQEGLDFSRVVTFNLDEYLGLSPEHPASFYQFMWKNLFSQVNIKPENAICLMAWPLMSKIIAFNMKKRSKRRRPGYPDLRAGN